jgi:hypothetical protein
MSFVGTRRVGGGGERFPAAVPSGKGQSVISGKCPGNHFQAGSYDTVCICCLGSIFINPKPKP